MTVPSARPAPSRRRAWRVGVLLACLVASCSEAARPSPPDAPAAPGAGEAGPGASADDDAPGCAARRHC